jgi:hypothetical protein
MQKTLLMLIRRLQMPVLHFIFRQISDFLIFGLVDNLQAV